MKLLSIFLLIIIPSISDAQSRWERLDWPGGVIDLDVSTRGLLAALRSGDVIVSVDSGASWTTRPIPGFDRAVMRAIRVDPNGVITILGAKDMDATHRYTTLAQWISRDTGLSWREYETENGLYSWDIVARTAREWYPAVTSIGWPGRASRVFRGSTGEMIMQLSPYSSAAPIRSIDERDGVVIVASGEQKMMVHRRLPGSSQWITDSNWTSWWYAKTTLRSSSVARWLLAVGDSLFISVDTGRSWNLRHILASNVEDIQVDGDTGHLVLRDKDYLLMTTNGGESWFAQATGGSSLRGLRFANTQLRFSFGPWDLLRFVPSKTKSRAVMSTGRRLDFGERSLGTQADTMISFINVGSETLRIYELEFDSNVALSATHTVIAPGDSGNLLLTFQFERLGEDTATLMLRTNTSDSLEKILILGHGKPNARIWPSDKAMVRPFLTPNPVDKRLTISCGNVKGPTTVAIVDINGRTVWETRTAQKVLEVEVEHLPQGVYTVGMTSGDARIGSARFVKKAP